MDDENEQWQFTKRGLMKAIDLLKIERLQIDPQFVAKIKPDLDTLWQGHHLAGLATANALFVRLPDAARNDDLSRPLRIMAWGWPGRYGATLTLTCFFEGLESRSRIAIPKSDESTLGRLLSGQITLVLVRGKRPIGVYSVNFAANATTQDYIRFHIDNVRVNADMVLASEPAHYWETLKCQNVLSDRLTASDQLSLGWYDVFDEHRRIIDAWLADARKEDRIPPLDALSFPPAVAALVSEIGKDSTNAAAIHAFLNSSFQGTGSRFVEFILQWMNFSKELFPKWDEVAHLMAQLVRYYLLSPDVSDCGKRLAWFDFRSNTFPAIVIDPANFPPNCKPSEYWSRLPWDVINYARGIAIRAHDFPIDTKSLLASKDTLPRAVDAARVSASADALMEEAVANKLGTIPPKACVDLGFGPFKYLEITECDPNVMFVCRNTDGEYFPVIVEPIKNYCSFHLSTDADADVDADLAERIDAGVKMLFAAIVRDFWVVEKRESVFSTRVHRGAHTRSDDEADGPRVVYVPRIRYTVQADADKCTEALEHTERRAHFVRGFIRRSSSASPHQLTLALRYGIDVPIGYTFVRPHERGKSTRDVIYRSRSALQCMYVAQDVTAGSSPSLWFQFERDVRKLMEQLGFSVQHVALSRRGDHGIDVYATKGEDLDAVNWVIQCKCWRPARKVYPAVVRELIGALQAYPRGTRGMIVTTSDFSSGAITAATEGDIRLMNGEEFVGLVKTAE